MRLDLNIARLRDTLYARAADVRDAAMAPAVPRDTFNGAAGRPQPVMNRAVDAFAGVSSAVYTDHLSAWNAVSRAYLLVRKFLPLYALDTPLAGALMTGTALTSLVGTLAGRTQRPDVTPTSKASLPPLAQRALVLGLLVTHTFVFQEAELSGLAASAMVHVGARMLPNRPLVQAPAAWVALGAYIVTAQVTFEQVGLQTRPIAEAPPRASTNTTCNGLEEICARALDLTMFPSAHNAMVTRRPFNHVPRPLDMLGMAANNQLLSLDAQFARGIRGFTVEYFLDDHGVLQTSHNTVWTIEPLKETLTRLRVLLDNNPRDIIRVIGAPQGKYDARAMQSAFLQALRDSGLDKYMRTDDACENGWQLQPSRPGDLGNLQVGDLIAHNLRAIVMTSGYAFTTFDAQTLAEFHHLDKVYQLAENGSATSLPLVLNLFSTFADWRTSDRINALMPDLLRAWLPSVKSPELFPAMVVASHVETSPIVALADEVNRQPTTPGELLGC